METYRKAKVIKGTLLVLFIFSLTYFIGLSFGLNYLKSISYSTLFYSLGKLAGLIGFGFLSILVISGDTARFFDRFFGMDRIIKFQRKFAIATLVMIILHPIFFMISSKSILEYITPHFSIIPLALGIISVYVLICVMIASVMHKMISHQAWQYIHILTYVLFFFSVYHAANWGSDSNAAPMKIMYGGMLALFIAAMAYRTSYKIRHWHDRFVVENIIWETKDTFTLKLQPRQPFSFKPGQFCFLRLNKDRLYARHPFSISGSPNEEGLSFTVKLKGRFTKALSELKKGEEVIVDGPFGRFIIEDEGKDLFLIAGGVGITPFMSIIKEKIKQGKGQKITLLYGSRKEEDIIFKQELDKAHCERVRVIHILSEEKESRNYECGYVNEETIKKHAGDINDSLFYICGPEPMKEDLIRILKQLGVDSKKIITEDFFW